MSNIRTDISPGERSHPIDLDLESEVKTREVVTTQPLRLTPVRQSIPTSLTSVTPHNPLGLSLDIEEADLEPLSKMTMNEFELHLARLYFKVRRILGSEVSAEVSQGVEELQAQVRLMELLHRAKAVSVRE